MQSVMNPPGCICRYLHKSDPTCPYEPKAPVSSNPSAPRYRDSGNGPYPHEGGEWVRWEDYERLTRERDQAIAERIQETKDANRVRDALAAGSAERDRLRAALVKHGTHATGCSNQRNVGDCSCGLWAALSGEPNSVHETEARRHLAAKRPGEARRCWCGTVHLDMQWGEHECQKCDGEGCDLCNHAGLAVKESSCDASCICCRIVGGVVEIEPNCPARLHRVRLPEKADERPAPLAHGVRHCPTCGEELGEDGHHKPDPVPPLV